MTCLHNFVVVLHVGVAARQDVFQLVRVFANANGEKWESGLELGLGSRLGMRLGLGLWSRVWGSRIKSEI